jgi:aspartyl-tRNA(Asn)/glutamyl-tRNA(Gln) amidotransferase subunit B
MMSTLEISDAKIEEGQLRVDVSIQVEGEKHSGPTVDIKNLQSPKHVEFAVAHEFERHVALLEKGQIPEAETRRYETDTRATKTIRAKEEEPDYRYFQDPDLPQISVSNERISAMYGILGEVPFEVKRRFTNQFGMDVSDVKNVFRNPWSIEMFTRLVWTLQIDPKRVYRWVYEYIFDHCEKQGKDFQDIVEHSFGHKKLVQLLEMVDDSRISTVNGKIVMKKIVDGDQRMPGEIAEDLGLVGTVTATEDVKTVAQGIISQHADVLDYCIKEKDNRKAMVIVGKVMGALNPRRRWDEAHQVGDPVVIK